MCFLLIKQHTTEWVSEPIIVNYINEHGEERKKQFTYLMIVLNNNPISFTFGVLKSFFKISGNILYYIYLGI